MTFSHKSKYANSIWNDCGSVSSNAFGKPNMKTGNHSIHIYTSYANETQAQSGENKNLLKNLLNSLKPKTILCTLKYETEFKTSPYEIIKYCVCL